MKITINKNTIDKVVALDLSTLEDWAVKGDLDMWHHTQRSLLAQLEGIKTAIIFGSSECSEEDYKEVMDYAQELWCKVLDRDYSNDKILGTLRKNEKYKMERLAKAVEGCDEEYESEDLTDSPAYQSQEEYYNL